jgi:DNA-binding NtrC family response regulator
MARVLVIDDEPDVRWVVRLSLELAGHEVIVADRRAERDPRPVAAGQAAIAAT